jgi:hypothetical protein
MASPRFTSLAASILAAFSSLWLFGCATDRPAGDDHPPLPPAAEMRGESMFFEGKLRAEVTLNRGRGVHDGDGAHRVGGHGRRHGGSRPAREDRYGGEEEEMPSMRLRPSTLPAVTLHLTREHRGAEPIHVFIHDLK